MDRERLARAFVCGFRSPARKHQVDAVHQVLSDDLVGNQRVLVQHAPGSGKTETIGLLAWEALRRGRFHHVVLLNYATDLEDQALKRLDQFWKRLGESGMHKVDHRRASSSEDVSKALLKNSVQFAMLQKFSEPDDGKEISQRIAEAGEESQRILVIIDEAHRGVPEEGAHMKAVEARYGAGQHQVFFTATPKEKTLRTHGRLLPDGRRVAFHCHSQRDAVASKYVLNPLEFYRNCVPDLQVNGLRLSAMQDPVSVDVFLEQLNNQRFTKSIMDQRVQMVLNKMPEVYAFSPVMTSKKHQIRAMVVLPTIQSVYDFGQLLRAKAKKFRTALGQPIVVGTFFSGMAISVSGDTKRMVSECESNGGVGVEECDIIVTCRKYLTGYDDWKVCAIFLATRILQPEFLQQILGRATRARPGEGKRRPLIFDLANNPDSIFASVMRFWEQTYIYPDPLTEMRALQQYISSFVGIGDSWNTLPEASLAAARRLPASEQVLLRAGLVACWRAAGRVSNAQTPVSFEWLRQTLEGLNLELKGTLFGGSADLAKVAARDAAAGQEPRGSFTPGGKPLQQAVSAKTIPSALKVLRSSLELGRRKRLRRDMKTPQPRKKRASTARPDALDSDNDEEAVTPEKLNGMASRGSHSSSGPTYDTSDGVVSGGLPQTPVKESRSGNEDAEIRAGLLEAVDDMTARFKTSLPAEGDVDTPDRRSAEMERFDFASAPLKALSPSHVTAARKRLSSELSKAFGECMKPWLLSQKAAFEQRFVDELEQLESWGSMPVALRKLQRACTEFEEATSSVGSRVAGPFKSGLKRKLLRKLSAKLGPEALHAGDGSCAEGSLSQDPSWPLF